MIPSDTARRLPFWAAMALVVGLWAGRSAAEPPRPREWVLTESRDLPGGVKASSPDGRTLATTSSDGTVGLWDSITGRHLRTLRGHQLPVHTVVFAPDGTRLASAAGWHSQPSELKVWDVVEGRERVKLDDVRDGPILGLRFTPDGTGLIAARDVSSEATAVGRWDVTSGLRRSSGAASSGYTYRVAISPDGETLALASFSEITLWDANLERKRATLKGHEGVVQSLSFSPDGRLLASGAGAQGGLSGPIPDVPSEVKLWDLSAHPPKERATLDLGRREGVYDLAFAPDGKTLAAGAGFTVLSLWDLPSHRRRAILHGAAGHPAFLAGGAILAANAYPGIRLFDTTIGASRGVIADRTIRTLTYHPNGKTVAAGLGDGTVALWDMAESRMRLSLQGHAQPVLSVAFSPDGKALASAGEDGAILLWDFPGGQQPYKIEDWEPLDRGRNHAGAVMSLAFSPDGQFLASGGQDATVRLWNPASAPFLRKTFRGHESRVSAVAFRPDGKTLASASHDGTIKLWDPASGRGRATIRGLILKVPKGIVERTRIVNGVAETVQEESDETEDQILPITALAYSPDGTALATGEGRAVMCEADSGRERTDFKPSAFPPTGLEGVVHRLAFSPDGKLLAVARDRTVMLSDARTGRALAIFEGLGAITSLAFSPDGKTLASGGSNIVQFRDVAELLKSPPK